MALRKQCVDGKRCGLGMSCELYQTREESAEVVALWKQNENPQHGSCEFWEPRMELATENDAIRRAPRIGGQKHNRLQGSNILGKDGKPLKVTMPKHLQLQLPEAPDLGVTRHIKNGRDIKKGD